MKIYIGPYITWWGPYQIADLLQEVGVSEDRCHSIGEWLANIKWFNGLCEWIHGKRRRSIHVRIDDYDVWGLDDTLALIILPSLKKIKEEKYSTPHTDLEDAPDILDDGDDEGFSEKRWDYILDEMIHAFGCINDDWEDQFHGEIFDLEGFKKAQERIDNGTRLFGKYYNRLWS